MASDSFRISRLQSEINLRPEKTHGSLRIALAYPNLYYVAMSNLGFQGVHAHFNSFEEIVCERAFLPEEEERASVRTLASFETATPLRDFDVVAFSVAFENDYLHVVQMLKMAGIPLRAKDRGRRDPLILIGGSATFLNPEPLAPFADVVAIGEGEVLVPKIVEAWMGHKNARLGLDLLKEKDGFYVPSRYQVHTHPDGTIAKVDGPGRVMRQRAYPGAMDLPQTTILTPHTE
ncbi:MAG: radical SAM protein, partial [Vicinamibacteria bacterium]